MRARTATRGYTLIALMIGVTVMTILIASVLPLASAEAQRDREEELIFRGRQYAEGIRVFRRRFGRYPNTLKELFETKPRCIRKLWKDPMLNSMDWGLVSLTSGAPVPGAGVGGTGLGRAPTPTPTPSVPMGGAGGLGGPSPVSAITGVYSKSKKKSYLIYQGRDVYDQWRFTEQTLNMGPGDTPETPGGVAGPGIGNPPPGGGISR